MNFQHVLEVSCHKAATIRSLDSFWSNAWRSANSGHHHSTQTPLETRQPLHPMIKSSPWLWLSEIQCCVVTWREHGQSIHVSGELGEVVTGNLADARADLSPPCHGGKPVSACTSWPDSKLPTALLLVPTVVQPAKGGLFPLRRTPGLGYSDYGFNHSLPRAGDDPRNLFYPLSSLPGAELLTWSLSSLLVSLVTCVSFLQPWLYSDSSSSYMEFSTLQFMQFFHISVIIYPMTIHQGIFFVFLSWFLGFFLLFVSFFFQFLFLLSYRVYVSFYF